MADRDRDLELERLFRDWTDSAVRAPVWIDEARNALAVAADQNRDRRRVFTLVGALVVLVAAVGLTIRYVAAPGESASSNSPPALASEQASPTPAPEPSIIPAADLPLSELAWWDEEHLGFGFIPEWTPPPNPPVNAPSHKLVHIGTLDGRITAVVALNAEWSHSYVSGPVGIEVLVVDDSGGLSTVDSISAVDGSRTTLFASDAIIPAAVLSPDGSEVFYGKFNRTTGADEGLWRQPRDGGRERLVLEGPLGDPLDLAANNLTIWRLTFSLDGRTIVAQSCFGEVRCISHFVDLGAGTTRSIDSIGWVQGVTNHMVIAQTLGEGTRRLVGVDLQTLESNPLYGGLEAVPGIRELMEHKGVSLPEGWVMRWADLMWTPPQSLDAAVSPQLVNVVSGERLDLPAFRAVVTNTACTLIPPAQMPEGQPAGWRIQTLEFGAVYGQWGSGQNVVFEAAGSLISPELASPGAVDVTIRGHPGNAADIGGEFFRQGAFSWEEGGCQYSVWLARGTSLDAAVEYAARY